MQNEIVKYLSKYIAISENLKKIITESSLVKVYKKRTVLLKQGAYANESYLVLKGCIRCYYLIDGVEKTTAFYTEECVLTPTSNGKNILSEYYLECTEDTVAAVGNAITEGDMFKKYPELESVCRVLSEVFLAKNQESFNSYIISSFEERYLKLLNDRSDLLQRVPQYQIASYLGVTPESLSSLRKRLMNKEKQMSA